LESNITSPSAEEQQKTGKKGRKKPPAVNHVSYYQILVIINRYELLRNSRKDEQLACEPFKTHELEMRNEDRRCRRKRTELKET